MLFVAIGLPPLLLLLIKEVKRKVARPKVVKEKARVRIRARKREELKLLLPQPLKKMKWTSLVMIPKLTPLLLKP